MAVTKERTPAEPKQSDTRTGKVHAQSGNVGGTRGGSVAPPKSAALDRVRYFSWYARMLLSEIRNAPRRIRIVSERMNHLDSHVELGPVTEVGSHGGFVLSKSTIARMEYITALHARYPWLTDADVLLALDGWDVGSGYRTYSHRSENIPLDISQRDLPIFGGVKQ